MTDPKLLIWALRDEGETVECARCGRVMTFEDAIPEEGGEWECSACNLLYNELERQELKDRF